MRAFLVQTCLFLLPLVAVATALEVLLRAIPNDFTIKRAYVDSHADEIETLILGSSHAYYAVDPEALGGRAFNAANVSQSLDLDYELLCHYGPRLPALRRIVVAVDYATLFYRLRDAVDAWRLKNYNLYYDLHVSSLPRHNLEILAFGFRQNVERLTKYYLRADPSITSSASGWGRYDEPPADLELSGETAADRHHAPGLPHLAESLAIADALVAYAERRNVAVLFYTSPTFRTYNDRLEPTQLARTVATLDSLADAHPHVDYANFMNAFPDDAGDYRDADHLNARGATRFAQLLRHTLDSLDAARVGQTVRQPR